MAKSKTKTVKASRSGVEKEFSQDQWNSMKENNALYGWRLKSDLPDDVVDKDKELENTEIKKLQKQVDDLTKENGTLKTSNTDLQKQVDAIEANKSADKEPVKAPAKSK